MYTTNSTYIMYGSWDMEQDRQNFFSFWTIFCPFTPRTTQKIKILKKWKKTSGDIINLHLHTTNEDHMMYGCWDLECYREIFFFSFWAIFCPFSHLTTQKIKFLKKWKKTPGDIIPLNLCTINENHMMYGSRDDAQQTEFVVIWVISCTQLDLNPQPLSSFS